jgi:ribosome biogenesis GTPase A
MGCLPGNTVELLQIAPFGDPLYLNVNGSHLTIRVETARNWSGINQNYALMINQNINVALIGNPNTGKTSVLIS